jgi:DNA-binding transcriptional ArsR family regulator
MKTKPSHSGMSDEALALIAARFKILSEPMRLKLIILLEEGEKNVTQLVEATGSTQANVSRHLGSLTGAGILARRKQGLMVYYLIADRSIFDLCESVCRTLQKKLEASARVFG